MLVIALSSLALLGGLAAGGLWCCRAWAFRLGLTLTVCPLALDLLWLALSFPWDLFELGPVLLLVLDFRHPLVVPRTSGSQGDDH